MAFALLVPASRHVAALAAAALLAGYAGAISINLWRGRRDIDCGCAGPEQAQPIRPVLLARNAVLVSLALVASFAPHSRDLGVFDSFVVIASAAVALLVYAAADGLMANSPRLLKLIGR
ncbi:Methylamine utilization protein MauE [compost metagenome]